MAVIKQDIRAKIQKNNNVRIWKMKEKNVHEMQKRKQSKKGISQRKTKIFMQKSWM
jgi:hypothetical protein